MKREMENLIPRFVDLHRQASKLLQEDKPKEAKQKYMEVLRAYHDIQKSPLEKFHKDIAYDQVTRLFSEVNAAKERNKVPFNMIAAAVLIIAFSILVVLKPSIVGLAAFDEAYRENINITFDESGLHELTLREIPVSLALSGEVKGDAKVFYKYGNKLELIVDTSQVEGGEFYDVCTETCTIKADLNMVTLFIDLENQSTLTLTGLTYNVVEKSNTPPRWKSSIREFKAKKGQTTMLDLRDYFEDDEDDALVFLSTRDDGLDVTVQDSYIALTPLTPGSKRIILIASDLLTVTRAPVTVEVGS